VQAKCQLGLVVFPISLLQVKCQLGLAVSPISLVQVKYQLGLAVSLISLVFANPRPDNQIVPAVVKLY
jgi:hypothetical protein